jgi:hypothetical protein
MVEATDMGRLEDSGQRFSNVLLEPSSPFVVES